MPRFLAILFQLKGGNTCFSSNDLIQRHKGHADGCIPKQEHGEWHLTGQGGVALDGQLALHDGLVVKWMISAEQMGQICQSLWATIELGHDPE